MPQPLESRRPPICMSLHSLCTWYSIMVFSMKKAQLPFSTRLIPSSQVSIMASGLSFIQAYIFLQVSILESWKRSKGNQSSIISVDCGVVSVVQLVSCTYCAIFSVYIIHYMKHLSTKDATRTYPNYSYVSTLSSSFTFLSSAKVYPLFADCPSCSTIKADWGGYMRSTACKPLYPASPYATLALLSSLNSQAVPSRDNQPHPSLQ